MNPPHNLVESFQDDAIYLSSPTAGVSDDVHMYQNYLRHVHIAFGFHSRAAPVGQIWIYRNIVDQRKGIHDFRPTPEQPVLRTRIIGFYLMHGVRLHHYGAESVACYHNTVIAPAAELHHGYAHGSLAGTWKESSRQIINNLFIYLDVPRSFPPVPTDHDIRCDGNLHWSMDQAVPFSPNFLEHAKSVMRIQNTEFESHSMVADPRFARFESDHHMTNDYHLQPDSPAVNAGVPLPRSWPDPLSPQNGHRPDIGALPLGGDSLHVGRHGRVVAS